MALSLGKKIAAWTHMPCIVFSKSTRKKSVSFMALGAETSHWSLCWIPLHKNHSNQSPSIPLVSEDSCFQPQYCNPFLVTPFLDLHNDSDPGQIWLCRSNLKFISGYSRSLGEERLFSPPRYNHNLPTGRPMPTHSIIHNGQQRCPSFSLEDISASLCYFSKNLFISLSLSFLLL